MSIGKNSIARAANATATKPATPTNDNSITKLTLDKLGLLSIAKKCEDLTALKSSIQKRGILCPLLVAATPKGDLWLVDGYSRYYAAKELDISQVTASIIKVENKSEANRIYTELSKIKPSIIAEVVSTNIHEEKFRVLAVKDHDLPVHLL